MKATPANLIAIKASESAAPSRESMVSVQRPVENDHFQQVGGHNGTFEKIDNGAALIKRTGAIEQAFYEQAFSAQLPICRFMPAYYGTMSTTAASAIQIKIENLTAGMSAPAIMDIKIGCRTASYSQLRSQGLSRSRAAYKLVLMSMSDSLSSSKDLGFRVVSHNKATKSPRQFALMEPEKLLKQFCPQTPVARLAMLEKMRELLAFVESPKFEQYCIIGASVLMAYDDKLPTPRVRVSLIDFAHSSIDSVDDGKRAEHIERFRYGMRRLFRLLNSSCG